MKHSAIAVLLCLLPFVSSAQTEVAPYQPGVTPEGITYFLPKTGLHFTLTATRTIHRPGEYAPYAERFLRLKDVPTETYEEWKINSLEVVPYGVADKEQAYTIRLNPKSAAPLVGLSPDGCLLSVNADAPAIEELSKPSVQKIKPAKPTPAPADFKTREVLSAGSTTKMAELCAAEIYDIRENRSLLTKGQADFMPKDGEQLRLMLEQLDTQETSLLALFKGTSESEIHTFTFDLVPDSTIEQLLLFRFSRHYGLVEGDDLAGAPYYIVVRDLKALPEESVPKNGKKAKRPAEDLRYCLPGRASITVAGEESTLVDVSVPFAQFGRIEHLGGELFNKKFTTSVLLSPITGGITRIDAPDAQ